MAKSTTFELAGRHWPKIRIRDHRHMFWLYVRLIFVVLTSGTNGYDGSMMNNLLALPQWLDAMGNPPAPIISAIVAIMSVGSVCAVFPAPYVADNLGRRLGIIVGCSITCLGVLIQSLGFNAPMFLVGRLVVGFGTQLASGSAPLLITELVHPQHRPTYATAYNTMWYVGSTIAAVVTYGTFKIPTAWSWRIPSICQCIPSVLQLIFVWTVPESPRWLISKGREDKALQVLADAHAEGNTEDEFVQVEYAEICNTIRLENQFKQNSWKELIATKGNRRRMLIVLSFGLFSQWSGNALVSYYLSEVLKQIGITYAGTILMINIILNVVNMISATGVSFFVDRAGRRPLMIGSAVAMCLCYTVQTITLAQYTKTQSPAASYTFVVFVFIYYISYNIGFMGLLVSYTSEIMPYRIRAKGLTVMFFAVDLALFFNQYVTGIAIRAISYWYYVCYCIWIAFEAFFVWKFYIETKNTPLEEIARHFDGDAALVDDDTGLRKNGDSRGSGAGLGLVPEVSDMGVRKRKMEDEGSDEKIQVERRE